MSSSVIIHDKSQVMPNHIKSRCGTCASCIIVQKLTANNIWLHLGQGRQGKSKIRDQIKYEPLKITNEMVITQPQTSISNFFSQKILDNKYEIEPKPDPALWFSRGRWLFDSFHDNCDKTGKCLGDLYNIDCVMIQNPINILTIANISQLNEFAEKYCPSRKTVTCLHIESSIKIFESSVMGILRKHTLDEAIDLCFQRHQLIDKIQFMNKLNEIIIDACKKQKLFIESIFSRLYEEYINSDKIKDDESDSLYFKSLSKYELLTNCCIIKILQNIPTEIEKDYSKVDWDAVRNDNYYGVAFEFSKVREITDDETLFRKYAFYNGFDVESLCCWDVRAFGNTVFPKFIAD